MHFKVHFHFILMCVFILQAITSDAIPCDSCGNECSAACGTKNFRTCCFNYLRKRNDPNASKLISNQRLIDFIMLQGRAMFTLNELTREHDEKRLKQAAAVAAAATAASNKNGTIFDVGLRTYYD